MTGTGYGPAAYPNTTSQRIPAAQPRHHLRYAIFHDGNPGHLWRGEFSSLLGEAVLGVGIIMWLAMLDGSPKDVAFALFALGLPALLAGPIAAPLTRVQEPAGLLRLFGWVRVLFALGLIGMHYRTILPIVYLLLFGIALCGRLRGALRIAATRACLAPGEPERVAASMHLGAAIVAVLGPLLASVLFLLNGERILAVAAGAAALFLLAASSDSLLDSLPRPRRAFLLARPEPDPNAAHADDEDEDENDADETGARDEDDEDAEEGVTARTGAMPAARLERALPEWQQWGPGNIREAVSDIGAGLGIAGISARATTALRSLATLALIGGGVSIFEVFLLTDHLYMPTFYLGALVAAEGAGLAVGAMFWSDLGRGGSGQAALFIGMLGTGAALAALAVVHLIQWALLAAFVMGMFNAMSVEGGREALRAGFNGVERRALAAAESFVVTMCALLGTLAFVLFHSGYVLRRGGAPLVLLQAFPVAEVLLGAGMALVVAGVVYMLWMPVGKMYEHARRRSAARAEERRARMRRDDEEDEMEASGAWEDSRGGGDWDDDDRYDSRYAESVGDSRYAESYGDSPYDSRYDSRYSQSVADSRYDRSYGDESRVGWTEESRMYPTRRDDDPDDDRSRGRDGRGGRGRR